MGVEEDVQVIVVTSVFTLGDSGRWHRNGGDWSHVRVLKGTLINNMKQHLSRIANGSNDYFPNIILLNLYNKSDWSLQIR